MPDDFPPLPPGSYSPGSPPASPGTPARNGADPAPPHQIVLHPAGQPEPRRAAVPPTTTEEPKDNFREVIETIVFVVVLVLLLKTFLAEAFVIPTGSMATTLLGYHRNVDCDQCGYKFPVNASGEEEGDPNKRHFLFECRCPNCDNIIPLARPNVPPGAPR